MWIKHLHSPVAVVASDPICIHLNSDLQFDLLGANRTNGVQARFDLRKTINSIGLSSHTIVDELWMHLKLFQKSKHASPHDWVDVVQNLPRISSKLMQRTSLVNDGFKQIKKVYYIEWTNNLAVGEIFKVFWSNSSALLRQGIAQSLWNLIKHKKVDQRQAALDFSTCEITTSSWDKRLQAR